LCAGTAKLLAKLRQENSEWNEGLGGKFEKRGLTLIFAGGRYPGANPSLTMAGD
jgi:hypothetical protein